MTERAVVPAARYWTSARMAAAARVAGGSGVSGVPWAGGGAVARTTGRVFFFMGGTGYACSGSAVASQNQDVVMTAAHCVSDGAGHWATHWTFVPGYTDGREPYGSYPAFDPRTGLGVITGVTTFRYSGQDRILYSADLGPVAQALYKRAAASQG